MLHLIDALWGVLVVVIASSRSSEFLSGDRESLWLRLCFFLLGATMIVNNAWAVMGAVL